MSFWTYHSDCVAQMKGWVSASFDAVVTDPPYELNFMSKKWDGSGIAFSQEMWSEVLRLLKPGAHLLAFGGTRTYHRMTCAIEDAGFEVRDSLHWFYGTGFPKSLNVSKAIETGGGPEAIRRLQMGDQYTPSGRGRVNYDHGGGSAMNGSQAPVELSEAARKWDGWGTALKPGHEPIVLARKPLLGTVAANVAAFGTGALNIDASRIGTTKTVPVRRWPSNVLLDEDAAAELNAQTATLKQGGRLTGLEPGSRAGKDALDGLGPRPAWEPYGDSGGASRFFYVAKPNRAERDAGCDLLPELTGGQATDRVDGSAGVNNPRAGAGRTGGARNHHPTVKPVDLMRYLTRLVTPPGGVVLDPFTGSGSTGVAALREGFRFVGIEKELPYFTIANARLSLEYR